MSSYPDLLDKSKGTELDTLAMSAGPGNPKRNKDESDDNFRKRIKKCFFNNVEKFIKPLKENLNRDKE